VKVEVEEYSRESQAGKPSYISEGNKIQRRKKIPSSNQKSMNSSHSVLLPNHKS
jgi:hypothetical protein